MYNARKKTEQQLRKSSLESERKTLSESLSSSVWKAEKLKIDLLERISEINSEIETVESIKNEIKARIMKKLIIKKIQQGSSVP